MHKRIQPSNPPEVSNAIRSFPHCDARVLHAPSECAFCDNHPDWQKLRLVWGIAFTGYEPEGKELPDPATQHRSLETINRWPGNIAQDVE